MWTLDFIEPNILCTTKSGVCIPTSYPIPKGAIKIDVNGEDPNEQQPPKQDPETKLQYLKGPVSNVRQHLLLITVHVELVIIIIVINPELW